MVRKNADDVLAELRTVGAMGQPQKAPEAVGPVVAQVTLERGEPAAELRDARGEHAVEAIDAAQLHLHRAVRSLEEAAEALGRLRDVWMPVDAGQQATSEGLEEPEGAPPALVAVPAQGAPEELEEVPDEEAYQRAREAALRKIRGEDDDRSQQDDEEDDVPYVGQVRVRPEGQDTGEVSLGTVGAIRPSFPAEG